MMPSDLLNIRFATTSDGVRIAYAVEGSGPGPPMIVMPGWVSHLELAFAGKGGAFNRRLATGRRIVLYDGRGTGLSDRDVEDVSLQARLKDLESVIEQVDAPQVSIFAWSQSSPVAMVYAAEHPERVSHLILYAAFSTARGRDPQEGALLKAVVDLIRAEWGVGARATMGFIHPDAERDELEESLAFFRQASSGETAARILEDGMLGTEVSEYLPRISTPALVMHRRDDSAVPLDCGRQVASLLPNARFLVFEGDHHGPFYGDAESVLRAIDEFTGVASPSPVAPAAPSAYVGPVTLMFTDLEGSTDLTRRLGDAAAQELLRDHDAIVRDALQRFGGTDVKHTGDGIMASFPSATAALECAVEIQRAVARRNEERDGAPIHVRIGLNSGEPVREGNDLFGTAVQLARRICDAAEPDQILVSNVVRELVAGKGFLFAEGGETALRGFEDPVRLYEVRWGS